MVNICNRYGSIAFKALANPTALTIAIDMVVVLDSDKADEVDKNVL